MSSMNDNFGPSILTTIDISDAPALSYRQYIKSKWKDISSRGRYLYLVNVYKYYSATYE